MLRNNLIEESIKELADSKNEMCEGEKAILYHYRNTLNSYKSDVIVVSDFIWESNIVGFLNGLKKYKVEELILTDTSTGLMRVLHSILMDGGEVLGAEEVEVVGGYEPYEKGLRVKVN